MLRIYNSRVESHIVWLQPLSLLGMQVGERWRETIVTHMEVEHNTMKSMTHTLSMSRVKAGYLMLLQLGRTESFTQAWLVYHRLYPSSTSLQTKVPNWWILLLRSSPTQTLLSSLSPSKQTPQSPSPPSTRLSPWTSARKGTLTHHDLWL